ILVIRVLAIPRFLLTAPPTTAISTLSLHDALPISLLVFMVVTAPVALPVVGWWFWGLRRRRWVWPHAAVGLATTLVVPFLVRGRSEEHTSELQSRENLVCRLLLEKKKTKPQTRTQP